MKIFADIGMRLFRGLGARLMITTMVRLGLYEKTRWVVFRNRPGRCCAKFMTCEIYAYWAICACVKYFDVKYFARDRVRVRVRVINFADVIKFRNGINFA